ncbi:hypothetical protein V500_02044 [Pseudogymnoascus sp. VKM F-4518 (FW-2643)]|nr:hypothetical protein V500_02044 [Pseudogymnoascus sp. VKM F-4518 (FW-2643)]
MVWERRTFANMSCVEESTNEHWTSDRFVCLGDSIHKVGKRAILKGQFHISIEELQSQVAEAEAATATASQRPRTTLQLIDQATIEEMDEESSEELYDSDLDELAL